MSLPTHIVFNAMSTHPGGGLTVLLGVLRGLKSAGSFPTKLTVLCAADATKKAIEDQGLAEVQQPLPDASGIKRQLWVNTKLPGYVANLTPNAFFSINQFVPRIPCPQVVYHLNVLRFMPIQKSGSVIHWMAEFLRNHSAKQALKKADANVYESEFIQHSAEQIYRNHNPLDQVIYIGLPDNLISANNTQSVPKAGQLMTITSPVAHKDNTTLIKTVAELVKQRPEIDWNLKIAGGFEELWAPYKTLAKNLGVFERIEWLGFLDQDSITRHLQASNCLVSTSLVESFCMVALESMARGCPPVVADCSAMPESLGDAGLLASPGDPTSFAEKVIAIHDSPELRNRLVERGQERIKGFTWSACGQQFAELFEQLTHPER